MVLTGTNLALLTKNSFDEDGEQNIHQLAQN